MDVVKFQIEKLKGKVVFETKPGCGTTFTLILPLTVAIIEVLMVQSGGRNLLSPYRLLKNAPRSMPPKRFP